MKNAVLLMTMGGPARLEDVGPFLFNLFNDPAILRLPRFIRTPLAWLIAHARQGRAKNIYKMIGGYSPLIEQTCAQAECLEKALGDTAVFIGFSYTHPFIEDVAAEMAEQDFESIVLLPLYPQYSTTTTESCLKAAQQALQKNAPQSRVLTIEHFAELDGLAEAWADTIRKAKQTLPDGPMRYLFTAHGLPEKIVNAGDPYPQECAQTARVIAGKLGLNDTDWTLCYQSKVGPAKWIGPSTDSELERAAGEGKAVLLVPISFVCEHSETLYELDILFAERAEELKIRGFARAAVPTEDPRLIGGLVKLIREALTKK